MQQAGRWQAETNDQDENVCNNAGHMMYPALLLTDGM